MPEALQTYERLFDRLIDGHSEVTAGKMMSAPALKKKGKVFAFYHNEKMTFKLGKGRDLEQEFGIAEYGFLSPFKHKPPMLAWYEIDFQYAQHWELLAREAMKLI